MGEVLPIGIVLLLGSAALVLQQRRFSPAESPLLLASFVAHVVSAFAQVWITRYVYGWGDMFNYYRHGVELAAAMRVDLSFASEVAKLVLHQETNIPFYVMGAGSSTGTMSGLCAALLFLLNDSLYAACLVIGIAAYFGKVALYRAFRDVFAEGLRARLLIATTLVPSVVFWSSGILKESVAIAGLGWMVFALQRIAAGGRYWQWLLLLVGGFAVALVKAYILFALIIAAAVWFYWRRAARAATGEVLIRPVYLLGGAVFAVGGVVLLGKAFPQYAFESLGEEAARYQELGAMVRGGSYYEMGDSAERSLVGQFAFAPVALLSSLFRPFPFEVQNAQMAINALETTALTMLFGRSILRNSWRWMWRTLLASPSLMFCLVFTITFGVAVGLATTNLGTLSRYRMPLVPFFAALILLWTAPPLGAGLPVTTARRAAPHGTRHLPERLRTPSIKPQKSSS